MEEQNKTRIVNEISRMMRKTENNDVFLALYQLERWIEDMDKPPKKGPLSKHLIRSL